MKILFVHYSRDDREFHCGIAALSAFIKRGGHQSALLIVNDSMTLEEFQAAVEKEAPRIVGFSIMTFQWKKVKELARKVKELGDIPVLAGGFHPTFWPEEVISSPHIDILCRGEGEHATLELLHEMEAGGEHRGIPNIWVKEAGKVISNEIRPLIHDLDTLPYWDYGLFRFEELLKQKAKATAIHQANVAPVAAGRGCPNSCSYCSNATMKRIYKGRGRWVRRRSVSHLLGEMKMLRDRYPVIAYEFWDEQFAVNRRWLEEFCRDYGREIGSPFSIFIRAEMCDLDTLKMLRDAGCMHLWMGVECGNEEYRRKVLNRFQTNEDIVRAFDNARRVGLMTMSLNMIGLPFETREMAMQTIEFNRRLRPNAVLFFIYQAFPGTNLYNLCVEKGITPPDDSCYWFERPDSALVQESFPLEEVAEVWQEYLKLQAEIQGGG